nr:unnamed protein product [Digitaria exilis]
MRRRQSSREARAVALREGRRAECGAAGKKGLEEGGSAGSSRAAAMSVELILWLFSFASVMVLVGLTAYQAS